MWDRLESIKNYFFLSEAEFLSNFLDNAEDLLESYAGGVQISKLKRLLEVSLRSSPARHDPYHEALTCDLRDHNLIQMLDVLHTVAAGPDRDHETLSVLSRKSMMGPVNPYLSRSSKVSSSASTMSDARCEGLSVLEAFTLDYQVEWPVSLIFNRSILCYYQVHFRLLLKLKHAERVMCGCWKNHQAIRKLDVDGGHNQAQILRMKMLSFLQNVLYYMTVEVIEPNWQEFMRAARKTKTVDELIQRNKDFLATTTQQCFLSNQRLLTILFQMINICLTFAHREEELISQFRDQHAKLASEDKHNRRDMEQVLSSHMKMCLADTSYALRVKHTTEEFDGLLKNFIEKLHCEPKFNLNNLAQRLNFNGFYENPLGDESFGLYG